MGPERFYYLEESQRCVSPRSKELRLRGSRTFCQRCGLDVIELGPALFQIGITLFFDLILIGAGAVAVTFIHHLDNVHAVAVDNAKWREAHAIEATVVLQIDKYLRGAGIRSRGSKDDGAALIGLGNRIVFYVGVLPRGRNRGIRADAKLHDEPGHHAAERGVVIIMILNQIVEAVGSNGRPR